MVILWRFPDWDYNPWSIDGLEYEDCRKVPVSPDWEGVRSYICTCLLKDVSESYPHCRREACRRHRRRSRYRRHRCEVIQPAG